MALRADRFDIGHDFGVYDAGCHHVHRDLGKRLRPIRKTWRSPFEKAEDEPDNYKLLHHVADEAEQKVVERFIEAIKKVRDGVTLDAIKAALERHDTNEVIRLLNLDETIKAALTPALTAPLEDVFIRSGRMTPANTLAASGPKIEGAINMRFDLTNPRATQFIRDYDFGLIKDVTTETRNAVRDVVLQAFEMGGHPSEQAKLIRDIVGLTRKQAQAVLNYRNALQEEELAPEDVARQVEAYQNKLLRLRATNIARTETLRASNAGQEAAWIQAADKGLLDRGTARREWLVTPDDRLCPLCEAVPFLNLDGVPLGGYFKTPVGPLMYPPLHPQCRCVANLIAF